MHEAIFSYAFSVTLWKILSSFSDYADLHE